MKFSIQNIATIATIAAIVLSIYSTQTAKYEATLGTTDTAVQIVNEQQSIKEGNEVPALVIQAQPHPEQPILDLIGLTEGTDKGDGYNETLAYGAFTNGDVNLTAMTLAEIDALQTMMLMHPKNSWNSSAVGRYQILRTTLRALKKNMGLDDTQKFTAELQDRLAVELLNGRGYSAWKAGKMSDQTFALNLAKEWASLPKPATGKSYYSNQNAAVDYAKVLAVFDQLRSEPRTVEVASPTTQGGSVTLAVTTSTDGSPKVTGHLGINNGNGLSAGVDAEVDLETDDVKIGINVTKKLKDWMVSLSGSRDANGNNEIKISVERPLCLFRRCN